MASRLVQVDQEGKWEDSTNLPTDLAEGDKVTALQYINEASKSDIVEWVFPPKAPTINAMSAGDGQHTTGTGIANYWIHQTHKNPDGSGAGDLFTVGEDGEWRSLNAIVKLDSGATITVRQSKGEFDSEDKQSKPVTITVT